MDIMIRKGSKIFTIMATIVVCITLTACTTGKQASSITIENLDNSLEAEDMRIEVPVRFERGIVENMYYDTTLGIWVANVYFPARENVYQVILPDSVLDDICDGYEGSFSFREGEENPDWAGQTFNINRYHQKFKTLDE